MPIRHEIKQGESVVSLSELHGLFAETIWNHPENAELKKKRQNMNVLMPGDILFIPDIHPKEVGGETNQVHKFQRKGIPPLFRLQLFDVEKPRANQQFTLEIDGTEHKGKTDSRGILELYVPANSKKGTLTIGEDNFRVEMDFSHLDPINEIAGIQKRLNNLGFYCGKPDNSLNEATKKALTAFQMRFELKETGEADSKTLAKLAEIHDKNEFFPPQKETSEIKGAIDNAFIES